MSAVNQSAPPAPISIPAQHRPLVTILVLACLILWLLFTGWNAYLFFHTAFGAPDPNAVDCNTGRVQMNWAHITACQHQNLDSLFNPSIAAINFYGLLAALVFAFSIPTSLAKINATRLAASGTAFALMIGRMVDVGINGALLTFLQTPNIVLYALTPFIMLFAGGTAILAFCTGITTFFGVLIGVPSLLFNQIIEFV